MSSEMLKFWSDPEFLRIIGTPHANGDVEIAPAPGVKGSQAGHEEIASFGNTQVGYPAPRPPAADSNTQVGYPPPRPPAADSKTQVGYPPPRPPAADTMPQTRAGNDTDAVTQPVHKNGKSSKGDAVADANKRVPNGPKQSRFQHPGDGEVVPVERAFEELGKKTGVVLESGSHAFHKDIWQGQMGKQGEPPIAFKYAGRIRLDVMRLTPEQLESFKVLAKAQAEAIAIGGGDRSGGANNGTAGDSHRTKTPDEHGDTHLHPSNGKATGGGGAAGGERRLPGNTQVSHPPPPPFAPPAEHAPHGDTNPVFRYPPKPGDGEVVPIERAFEELGRKSGQVLESGSHSWHKKLWQEQLGKQGEPPVAFQYGGKIRVDVERLTPEQLETFIKLDQAQASAIAAGTGGGKGGGAKGGGGNAGGTGPEASHQSLANKVNAYDAKVKKLQAQFDALQKKQASARPSKQLAAERASLDAEQKALLQEGETLSMEMAAVGEQELKAVFKTVNPKELLNLARKGFARRATVGAMAGIAVTLATAYFVALDIRYILDADNALEALERAGQVGANYAVGTAEFALFKLVTGSNAVTAILAVVVGMCGDSAGACDAQEAEKKKEEEAKQMREQARQQSKAVGDFLAKHVPGSVMWVEDHYEILNRKVWDETVKKIEQMQRQYRADRKAGVHKRAHDLGMNDARVMGKFVNKDEMKGWPEVKERLTDEYELFDDYKRGFAEGNKKREAVLHRASELGYQDGKTGTKAHFDDIFKWPEVEQLIKDGAVGMFVYQELGASYNDAFDIKTGKKDPYEGLKD